MSGGRGETRPLTLGELQPFGYRRDIVAGAYRNAKVGVEEADPRTVDAQHVHACTSQSNRKKFRVRGCHVSRTGPRLAKVPPETAVAQVGMLVDALVALLTCRPVHRHHHFPEWAMPACCSDPPL
jgi:hypothetical protein